MKKAHFAPSPIDQYIAVHSILWNELKIFKRGMKSNSNHLLVFIYFFGTRWLQTIEICPPQSSMKRAWNRFLNKGNGYLFKMLLLLWAVLHFPGDIWAKIRIIASIRKLFLARGQIETSYSSRRHLHHHTLLEPRLFGALRYGQRRLINFSLTYDAKISTKNTFISVCSWP